MPQLFFPELLLFLTLPLFFYFSKLPLNIFTRAAVGRGRVSWQCHVCHGSATCAMAVPRVPWQCHVCHGSATCAMGVPRVPWQCHVCHGSATCAMGVPRVPWECHVCHGSATCAMGWLSFFAWHCAVTV